MGGKYGHWRTRCAVVFAVIIGALAPAHAACGDRLGPGYRGPDGKCVSWISIARVCGCTLPGRCTAEKVRPGADKAAKLGCEIRKLRGR